MMVEVLSSGLYTTIQDLGRFKYRKYGVPVSGSMDDYSSRLANRLVGNTIDMAVLEITYIGPVLRFTTKTQIAITGAGYSPTLNNVEIPLNTRIAIEKNSILKFGLPSYGMRAYIAVFGGFRSEMVLGSFSYYNGITSKSTLETGDILPIPELVGRTERVTASVKIKRAHFLSDVIEVFKGPEFEHISADVQQKLLRIKGVVLPESNRMACMLAGYENLAANEIITAPVRPGIVQLTPSGKCVVLMRDAQTTGGYARVLLVTEKGMNTLAQKRAGEYVQFSLI